MKAFTQKKRTGIVFQCISKNTAQVNEQVWEFYSPSPLVFN